MRFFLLITIVCMLSACATRTKYGPHGDSGGYSESKVDKNIMVARFSGNAHTHKNDALLFSQFRAIEICRDQRTRVARFLAMENNTQSKTVQKTYNYQNQNPTYFNGTMNTNTNYNYNGRNTLYSNSNSNFNGAIYGGGTYGGSQTWNETYTYPIYDTYFTCTNSISMAGLDLKLISAEDIKEFTKDKLGGVQVIEIGKEFPNKDIFQVGDIVLKVDNNRVLTINDFSNAIDESKNKDSISASIVREGNSMTVMFKAIDITQYFENMNKDIVRIVCSVPEVRPRPICNFRDISSEK